jgi:hypothetical protein
MERVDTLIKRLLEQQVSNADAASMLLTAQMLVHELQSNKAVVLSGKKISIIHPATKNAIPPLMDVSDAEKVMPVKTEKVAEVWHSVTEPVPQKTGLQEERKLAAKAYVPLPRMEEIPTFAYQQKETFDLNDSISAAAGEQTLNESLKTEKRELATLLKDSPVKDLKKAIGINDRFVFIEELFRGDENMYERSIKTINGFSIFPEAEYWIQRELKTKIGWDEESEAVKHFDQLVRRRFS